MMEDDQNLKKSTGKGTQAKTSKKAGKTQKQANLSKTTRLTSIWLTLLKCSTVLSNNTNHYE